MKPAAHSTAADAATIPMSHVYAKSCSSAKNHSTSHNHMIAMLLTLTCKARTHTKARCMVQTSNPNTYNNIVAISSTHVKLLVVSQSSV